MLVFHSAIVFARFCFDLTEHFPDMHFGKAHKQMNQGGIDRCIFESTFRAYGDASPDPILT